MHWTSGLEVFMIEVVLLEVGLETVEEESGGLALWECEIGRDEDATGVVGGAESFGRTLREEPTTVLFVEEDGPDWRDKGLR